MAISKDPLLEAWILGDPNFKTLDHDFWRPETA